MRSAQTLQGLHRLGPRPRFLLPSKALAVARIVLTFWQAFRQEFAERQLLFERFPQRDMASKPQTRKRRVRGAAGKAAVSVATGASWLALVAATTLGLGQVGRVRAEISGDHLTAEDGDLGEAYRLIVQSYSPEAVGADYFPGEHARPLGSVQRAITPEELKRGIAVDVVQIGNDAEPIEASPIVVAWIERGQPDLDFDGLEARPRSDTFYGVARSPLADLTSDQPARVVLKRHAV